MSVMGLQNRKEEPVSSAVSAPSIETGNAHYFGKKDKNLKGVISDIMLWTDLYESESMYNHRSHFDSFTQWCHSAHMIPFLQRCYRRCGIAGLVPGQHSGGHKHSMDPGHPLVLPTVPGFCYGHCYPLYRVLQYFYGGMEHIVCSVDDPH